MIPELPMYPAGPGPNRDCTELSVEADPQLVAEGWVRRHLADPARAEESIELYESLGYEVRAETLSPADFGPGCSACAPVVGRTCVLIYTRATENAHDRDTKPPQ